MGTKNFSNANDLITFSRASAGTALRKVAYGPELVTNGTFDSDISGWTNGSNAGGAIAWSAGAINLANTSGTARAYQSFSTEVGKVYRVLATETGGTTSFQVYVGESQAVANNINATTTGASSTFDGVFVATAATTFINVRNLNAATTAAVDNISVKEVLFDQGDLTLFNHPAGIPRIEYDADGNVLGLLVEESRTNLFTYSQPTSDGFTVTRASLVTSTVNAPDGNYAKKLVEDSTAANSHLLSTGAVGMSLNTTYTMSWFAKAAERDFIAINIYSGTTSYWTWFDLSNGTVGTATNSPDTFIEYYGDGWYRCGITVTTAASGSPNTAAYIAPSDGTLSYDGDGTSGIYIWGAQLEAGAFPTSYIPTAGSTATRSADVASIPVADFGYNQSEGTLFVEFDSNGSDGADYPQAVAIIGSASTDVARIGFNQTNTAQFVVSTQSGGNQAVLNNGTYTPKSPVKFAGGFEEDNFASSMNGSAAATDVSGSVPSNLETMGIGKWATGNYLNGHIKSIKYYPRRLSNAQLVELTS